MLVICNVILDQQGKDNSEIEMTISTIVHRVSYLHCNSDLSRCASRISVINFQKDAYSDKAASLESQKQKFWSDWLFWRRFSFKTAAKTCQFVYEEFLASRLLTAKSLESNFHESGWLQRYGRSTNAVTHSAQEMS